MTLVCCSRNTPEGTQGAYQDLGLHSWPVDEVVFLVDHDRLGDGGHARASWRLWAWAECLQGLVRRDSCDVIVDVARDSHGTSTNMQVTPMHMSHSYLSAQTEEAWGRLITPRELQCLSVAEWL